MNFWVIKTFSKDEPSPSNKYITTTREDAEAHRMEYADWYGKPGEVTINRIDEHFNILETIEYWEHGIYNHFISTKNDLKYLVIKGTKVSE